MSEEVKPELIFDEMEKEMRASHKAYVDDAFTK